MNRFPKFKNLSKKQIAKAAIPVIALALIASVVTGREKPAEVVPASQPVARLDARVNAKAAVEQDLDLTALVREKDEAKVAPEKDPFARRTFAPAPAAPAPETGQAARAPGVPALPFTYLGKMIDDGSTEVFLGRGDDSYSVRAGQKIDRNYRVDKVTEARITIIHLPTKTRQTLEIE